MLIFERKSYQYTLHRVPMHVSEDPNLEVAQGDTRKLARISPFSTLGTILWVE